VKIPKFKVENKMKLNNYYEKIGMKKIFEYDKNFLKIYDGNSKISLIQHNIYLNIDEEGTGKIFNI
jgi:serine protease inhibitor